MVYDVITNKENSRKRKKEEKMYMSTNKWKGMMRKSL